MEEILIHRIKALNIKTVIFIYNFKYINIINFFDMLIENNIDVVIFSPSDIYFKYKIIKYENKMESLYNYKESNNLQEYEILVLDYEDIENTNYIYLKYNNCILENLLFMIEILNINLNINKKFIDTFVSVNNLSNNLENTIKFVLFGNKLFGLYNQDNIMKKFIFDIKGPFINIYTDDKVLYMKNFNEFKIYIENLLPNFNILSNKNEKLFLSFFNIYYYEAFMELFFNHINANEAEKILEPFLYPGIIFRKASVNGYHAITIKNMFLNLGKTLIRININNTIDNINPQDYSVIKTLNIFDFVNLYKNYKIYCNKYKMFLIIN